MTANSQQLQIIGIVLVDIATQVVRINRLCEVFGLSPVTNLLCQLPEALTHSGDREPRILDEAAGTLVTLFATDACF